MAEKRISRECRVLGYVRFVTSSFVAGAYVVPKPERWRGTVSMNYGVGEDNNTRVTIFTRGREYLNDYWPDPTVQGVPKFYSDYDYAHWLIAPTPDSAYPFEAAFYELPQPLDETNQQNWTTTYAPNLLLYACLLECVPYLNNDERIPTWESRYADAKADLMGEDQANIMDSSSIRTGSA